MRMVVAGSWAPSATGFRVLVSSPWAVMLR